MMKQLLALASLVMLYATTLAQTAPIPSGVYHWADAKVTKSADRESRRFMLGSTAELSFFEIHATTQYKGAVAKPAHAQKDLEELLFVKEGTGKFTIGGQTKVLGKGSLVLVPPQQMQSIENVGDGPLTYYAMQFRSKQPMDLERSAKAGGVLMLNADSLTYKPSEKGGGIKYMQRPTAMHNDLELHITELKAKGPSHTPHMHIDTELILMITGNSEMVINGQSYQATAGDIYLANSNQLHGISNTQDAPCRYLAIRWK